MQVKNKDFQNINDASSIKIKRKYGTISYYQKYRCTGYVFYDSEGIFISASINDNNYLQYIYPSLYTIRIDNSCIIKVFNIMSSDSGGNNIGSSTDGLKIVICYI